MKTLGMMIAPGLATVVIILGITACGEEQNDAAKVGNSTAGAMTIAFPDGFSNAAAKCFGTDMVYTTPNSNGRAIAVSPGHPWCADGILTREETNR